MLRGHSLGGSRKLNCHWQSGGIGLWGRWIVRKHNIVTAQYQVEEYGGGPGDVFIKNAVIPSNMNDTRYTNYYKDCTWLRAKFTADTDLDFILFPQTIHSGSQSRWYGTGVQGKKIYSPLEVTINSTVNGLPFINLGNNNSQADYLYTEDPDFYLAILKKGHTLTPDTLYVPLVSEDSTDLISCYRVHQSMEVYIPIWWYGTTGLLPDYLITNRLMIYQREAPGTMLIQASITNWSEVERNGFFYD